MNITKIALSELKKLIKYSGCGFKSEHNLEPYQPKPDGTKQYFGKIDLVVTYGRNNKPFAAFELHHSGWADQAKKNVLNLIKFREDYPSVLLVVIIVLKQSEYDEKTIKYYWRLYENVFEAFSKLGIRRGKNFKLWLYTNYEFYSIEENGKVGGRISKEMLDMELSKYDQVLKNRLPRAP